MFVIGPPLITIGGRLFGGLMLRLFSVMLAALLITPSVSGAVDRTRLGYGRMITNDFLGDLQDRERTGSVVSSRVWGSDWSGRVPTAFGDLIELRLGVEVLAPDNLDNPRPGSRPWAGALSAGLHTHFRRKDSEISAGLGIYATGPQNGLGMLQYEFHKLIGDEPPSARTLTAQIDDGFHPTVLVEVGQPFGLTAIGSLRPFVEAQAGIETFVRAGVDLTFGSIGRGGLLLRDPTSGQRYRVIQNGDNLGFSFVAGADIAYVEDSTYLPEDRGYTLTDHRDRVRMGVHWQGVGASAFYGVTWLGKEYESQPHDQVVGSIRVNLNF